MKIDRTNTFITKANLRHKGKYDYSKVEYVDAHTKVCIICPEHGEFWQTPNSHLNGCGCPNCGRNKRPSIEDCIVKFRKIHGDKYDYSKAEYINAHTKICVICPIHGEFWVSPANHLRERGCPKCRTRQNLISRDIPTNMPIKKHTNQTFIKEASKRHKNKYDYSKVEYINNKTKVCIICPEHGEFWQRPDNHLKGQGCKQCAIPIRFENKKTDFNEWIQTASKLHNNKYDYRKSKFITVNDKMAIICPEHGEFWQTPAGHLQGQGCPYCKESSLEKKIERLLIENNLKYFREYKSNWLVNRNNKQLSLDFFLPEQNIAIECQGLQHFKPINFFGGVEKYLSQVINDEDKRKKCIENNIKLIYFSNLKEQNVITDLNKIKKIICDKL